MGQSPATDAEGPRPSPGAAILLRQLSVLAACAVAAGLFIGASFWLKAHGAGFWVMIGLTALYGAAILAIVRVMNQCGDGAARSAARRRYDRRLMTAMSVYVVVLTSAIGAVARLHPSGLLAWSLAIAVAAPVVASIVIIGLYLREEPDEFERRIQGESGLWATGGLLVLTTVWGFLEMFHLVRHVEVWWGFPIWCALLGPAQFIVRRRYQ